MRTSFLYIVDEVLHGLAVLEQASPSVVLTSSKADDKFMDICREYMDTAGGLFQIRPHKDFNPVKGHARLLSVGFLLELPHEDLSELQAGPDSESTSEARNAYEFMRRRRDEQGDPSLKRWNASIRMSNFASVDSAPLCVGSIGALLDHLTRERAVGELEDEGIGGLEVRGIEALALDEVMQINADALS
ncbi:hypothetical protein EWM64_g3085 [Hericium alpestre]|uniref:Uncharacterized protein n=1 Tax=Hericium alpestre TaxID=135208 RepID=A0A4Z0A3M3_9AGAM|nr:hypothetical protein EWM64_g3085 [Hericium alpestre]